MTRKLAATLTLPLLALATGGCVESPTPPQAFLWEGTLEPSADAELGITGSLAIASERRTQVGIGIEGGEEGETYGWLVREGSCQGNGDPVVSRDVFPALTADEAGMAQMEAMLHIRLSESAELSGEVTESPDGGDVLACGDLHPEDPPET